MKDKPTARDLHDLHADERIRYQAAKRQQEQVQAHEHEIRSREQDRVEQLMRRRLLALLPSVDERPCDFDGCVA